MQDKTLVIAFDGMDNDLIERYNLEEIKQSEFGSIDNHTGMNSLMTSELFASFITGKTWREHGVTGLDRKEDEQAMEKVNKIISEDKADSFKGLRTLREILKSIFKPGKDVKYTKEDLEEDTVFDKIDNSRAMFVPGYNPSKIWAAEGCGISLLGYGYSVQEVEKFLWGREFSYRKSQLLHEIGNEIVSPRDFLMCHFHITDWIHHLYADEKAGRQDEEKVKDAYKKIDRFAGEIKKKAEKSAYDRIIFMSDHGLPEGEQHNQNAFYSCNQELFPEKEPRITDFYRKFVDLNS
jgi:hypothetical protein